MEMKWRLSSKVPKIDCPKCGARRSFRRYVNGMTVAPGEYGSCDRINTCGYQAYPGVIKKSVEPRFVEPPKPISYTDPKDVVRSFVGRESTPFFQYCKEKFGKISTEMVFNRYNVGKSSVFWNASTFWFVDVEDKVRGGLSIIYKADGHRDRSYMPKWEHDKGYNYVSCMFGEHLVAKYPNRTIAIVEAPKSAVLGALFYPEKIWVGTNGLTTLQEYKMPFIKGRDVILYPDVEPSEYPPQSKYLERFWEKKCELLRKTAKSCTVFEGLKLESEGTDIADII